VPDELADYRPEGVCVQTQSGGLAPPGLPRRSAANYSDPRAGPPARLYTPEDSQRNHDAKRQKYAAMQRTACQSG